nr:endomucin isoform X1 [Zootoca vivipara]
MPAAQRRSTMELLGRVLLSAALLTLCCVGGNEDINTTPSKGPTSPGSTTTISTTKASQETSSRNTSKAATADNTTTIANSSANSSATAQPTQTSALSTSNNTASTGTAESPALSTVTSSHSALTTPAQHNKTTSPNKNATQRSVQDTLQKATEVPIESNTVNAHSEKQDHPSYTTIILPVIIALIVISLSVFLLVILYRMCLKTTPERQENGTEQAPSDKENVKLISVKATSPENGDQASQGKNRTRQQNDLSSSRLGNKQV